MTELSINEEVYYDNKPTFSKLLKSRNLKWGNKLIDNKSVDGWFNDSPEYVQKLPEQSNLKRFHIVGCPEIVDFLSSLKSQPMQSNDLLGLQNPPWKIGESWKWKREQLLSRWDITDNFVKWS